ncbi:TAXI family TRAP transporter solute-binding subunit [Virgibacillus ihumii]|uniref:TAXI family TRAP transporter solute-binding subunit n=1 Tax=Virgibacillus ihumii TaxID=2686091 RepID=UPI00157E03E8|nr:TAXI family TRAP transporter solute-binding subunit [Virgibacillus ihumii]
MFASRKIIFVMLLIGLFFLAACESGDQATATSDSSGKKSGDEFNTTIVGGRTGGAWSVFTEGIAESIRREIKGSIVTVEPGGIVENPVSVSLNKTPYGLSYAMTAYAAYSGNEPYDRAYPNIRAISVVIPANYYQLLARGGTEYDSMDEIIENQTPVRLAVDQEGSAGEIITRTILKEYGVTYADIKSWGGSVDHLSGSKTFELMADNRIDAAGDAVSVPSGDIVKAASLNELKFLSINKDVINAVSEKLGMESGVIKSGSYAFQEQNVHTLYTPAILIANKDVSEKEVYRVTKAIYQNLDYLRTVHKEFANLTDKNIAEVGEVPLHPGAEKFFKEVGLLD